MGPCHFLVVIETLTVLVPISTRRTGLMRAFFQERQVVKKSSDCIARSWLCLCIRMPTDTCVKQLIKPARNICTCVYMFTHEHQRNMNTTANVNVHNIYIEVNATYVIMYVYIHTQQNVLVMTACPTLGAAASSGVSHVNRCYGFFRPHLRQSVDLNNGSRYIILQLYTRSMGPTHDLCGPCSKPQGLRACIVTRPAPPN